MVEFVKPEENGAPPAPATIGTGVKKTLLGKSVKPGRLVPKTVEDTTKTKKPDYDELLGN